MASHTSVSLEATADRLAIRELFDAYAHCADTRDAEGQKALFTTDTRFVVCMDGPGTDPSYVLDGREALSPVFDDLNRYEVTMHFNGQSTVTMDGDRATGDSYTIAHHVFGPGNENAFKYFNSNYYDEKGRLVPGYQALFNRFSQTDVVKQIMKGSAQTQAEYKNFMNITVREDILRNDLPKLKEYFYTPNAPYTIGWDTETKHLTVETNPKVLENNTYARTAAAGRKPELNQTIHNVNMTLDGLRNISETMGKKDLDIDAYVLSPVMQSLGDISDIKGMPSALALTIKGAYLQKKFETEASQGPGNKSLYTNPPKAGK